MTKENKIKVTLVASPFGRKPKQRQTLVGLGLKKIGAVRLFDDTPAIQGMIDKVSHLLKVER